MRSWLLLGCLACWRSSRSVASATNSTTPSELRLGIFISWEGGWDVGDFVSPAVLRAIDDINARTDILPSTALKWVWHDGQCVAKFATEAMMDMKLKYDVDAFVGPPCSVSALRTVPMGAYWDLPFISWAAASPSLSDKALYPNFARVNGNYRSANVVFLAVAKHFQWDHLAVVYADNGLYSPTADDLISRIRAADDVVLGFSKLFPDTTVNNADQSLAWMPLLRDSGNRVVVVLGHCVDMRNILLSASRLDMLEGYQYFLLDVTSGCHVVNGDVWPTGWGPEANAEAAKAFDNTFNVLGLAYESPETAAFKTALLSDFESGIFEPYRFPPAGTIIPSENVTKNPHGLPYKIRTGDGYQSYAYVYAALLYDAIELYARAADRVITNGGDPSETPGNVTDMLPLVNFTGLSGYVQLDENLDRSPDFALQQVRRSSDSVLSFTSVGSYASLTRAYSTNAGATVVYPGGGTTAPASFVLRECTSADYAYEVDDECNAELALEVMFMLRPGVECEDTDPEASADCVHLPAGSGVAIAVYLLAALGAVVAFAVAMWVGYHRLEPVVKAAQPEFCVLFLIGCLLVNVSMILRVGKNTTVSCVVAPYLFHLSFTLGFSALLSKVYRVWRIFESTTLQIRKSDSASMLRVCAALVLMDAVVLAVIALISPMTPRDVTERTQGVGVNIEQTECGEGGNYVHLLWAIKIFLMIGTSLISCQVRHVDERFAESKHIVVAVSQMTTLSIVAAIVAGTSSAIPLRILIQAFAVSVASTGSVCAIFGPKILVLHGWADESRMFGKAQMGRLPQNHSRTPSAAGRRSTRSQRARSGSDAGLASGATDSTMTVQRAPASGPQQGEGPAKRKALAPIQVAKLGAGGSDDEEF